MKGVGGHRRLSADHPAARSSSPRASSRTLQTLVSREVDPQEAAVVTVGMIKGSSTHNIIGSDVTMLLTVRSFKPEVRKLLLGGITPIAKGEAIAAGVPDDPVTPRSRCADNSTPAHLQHPAAFGPE